MEYGLNYAPSSKDGQCEGFAEQRALKVLETLMDSDDHSQLLLCTLCLKVSTTPALKLQVKYLTSPGEVLNGRE